MFTLFKLSSPPCGWRILFLGINSHWIRLASICCLIVARVSSLQAATPTYDEQHRLTRILNSDGSGIDYTYDANGNQTNAIPFGSTTLAITVDPPGSGTTTGAGRFPLNSTQALTATPGSAFDFVGWFKADGTLLSSAATYTHPITTTETLTARFFRIPAPVITTHPIGGQNNNGSPLSLTVAATGRGPLTYQWRHNGTLLPDTTAALTRTNLTFLDAGSYTAEVTGPGGTTQSQSALITIPILNYTTWRNTIFTPEENTANNPALIDPEAKIGADDMTNLMHYALGARSRESTPEGSIGVSPNSAFGDIFSYNRLLGRGGLIYSVRVSTDLNQWDDSGIKLEEVGTPTTNGDGITETVRVRLKPSLSNTRTFFQLSVRLNTDLVTVFSDYFSTQVDPAKWDSSGNVVSQASGLALIRTTVTDAGGILTSKPIAISPYLPLSFSRDVVMGYANDKSIPSASFYIGNLPKVAIHYGHMIYDSSIFRSVEGLYLSRNDKSPIMLGTDSDIAGPDPVPWQKWVHEQFGYNPTTGLMSYYQDDVLIRSLNVGAMPPAAPSTLTFSTNAWGWGIGHIQQTDCIEIAQSNAPALQPAPTPHKFADFFNQSVDANTWAVVNTVNWVGGQAQVLLTAANSALSYMVSKYYIPVDLTRPVKITIVGAVHAANHAGIPRRIFWFGSKPFVTVYNGDLNTTSTSLRVVNGMGVAWNGSIPWLNTSDGFRSPEVPVALDNRQKCEYVYDPVSGEFRCTIDGQQVLSQNIGPVPTDSPQRMHMQLDSAGISTGHSQVIDYILVDQ